MMRYTIMITLLAAFFLSASAPTVRAEKWKGIDETVVEKVAQEHGRAPVDPIINTDQGDLLLFVFLVAGTIGGFFAGYFYRRLTEPYLPDMKVMMKDTEDDA